MRVHLCQWIRASLCLGQWFIITSNHHDCCFAPWLRAVGLVISVVLVLYAVYGFVCDIVYAWMSVCNHTTMAYNYIAVVGFISAANTLLEQLKPPFVGDWLRTLNDVVQAHSVVGLSHFLFSHSIHGSWSGCVCEEIKKVNVKTLYN